MDARSKLANRRSHDERELVAAPEGNAANDGDAHYGQPRQTHREVEPGRQPGRTRLRRCVHGTGHVVGAEEVFRDRAVEDDDLDVRIGFELPDERLELEDHLRVDFVDGRIVEPDQPQLGTFDGDGEAVGHGGLLVCVGIRAAPASCVRSGSCGARAAGALRVPGTPGRQPRGPVRRPRQGTVVTSRMPNVGASSRSWRISAATASAATALTARSGSTTVAERGPFDRGAYSL